MHIEILENPNIRVLKSQSDIMHDYKTFLTKVFYSLTGDQTH